MAQNSGARPSTRTMTRGAAALTVAGVVAAVILTPSRVDAQNALGDGRALDANLRVGSGGINPKGRDLLAEIRFRNAIVTGNAPAGMSLRIGVGYTATNDFRERLGSNDIFNFERDSLLSDIAGRGIRGIDALQIQMRLATGAVVNDSTGLPLLPIVSRAGTGASGDQSRKAQSRAARLDPFRARPRGLRSITEFRASDALAPVVLGAATTKNGEQVYALASSLRGLQMTGVSPDDALPTSVLAQGFALPSPAQRFTGAKDEDDASKTDRRISSRVEPSHGTYEEVLAHLRERMAEAREVATKARESQVESVSPDAPPAPGAGEPPVPHGADTSDDANPGDDLRIDSHRALDSLEARLESMRDALLGVGKRGEGISMEKALDEARQLLAGDSPVVETLTNPPRNNRDYFAAHMAQGERLLAKGRWFDAEERFSRALSIQPGEVTAAIGRVHAQLGAGLYLSAAVNLERLLLAHPELVTVRYAPALLPSPSRLESLTQKLERLLTEESAMQARAGLLLAYIGWQKKDVATIKQGLDAMRQRATDTGASNPLEKLLRTVWLDKDS